MADYRKLNGKVAFISLLRRSLIGKETKFLRGQFPFVDYIIHHEGCTQNDIANALHITPASVAVTIGNMENSGLVTKEKDDTNARKNVVKTTDECKRLYIEGKAFVDSMDEKEFSDFTDEELNRLDECLDKLIFNLTGEEEVTQDTFNRFIDKCEEEKK